LQGIFLIAYVSLYISSPAVKEFQEMAIRNAHLLVCGAGGFIGGHLVNKLLAEGAASVRAVDLKPFSEWYQRNRSAENLILDLQLRDSCLKAAKGMDGVFQLAADMGGMGFIENNKALCMLTVLTSTHMLVAARDAGVKRFFYSSSACVYNGEKQKNYEVVPLKEEDAYPAMPEDGYGWEKLFTERMCRHFHEDFGLETRIARFHNVYGPHGTWDGDAKKLRRPSVARYCRPNTPANARLKSGATAVRRAALCTSTTAPRG
jgi:GDP-D-mannose 3',5'-epimerase